MKKEEGILKETEVLKNTCKTNRGRLFLFFICIIPVILVRILQVIYDKAISYGNSDVSLEYLCLILFGFSILCVTVYIVLFISAAFRAKYAYSLFLLVLLYFSVGEALRYVENVRKLARERIALHKIETVGNLTINYIHQQGTFQINNSTWTEGLITFIKDKSDPFPWAPHESKPFPSHSFNKSLIGKMDSQIKPDDVLVFEKPRKDGDIIDTVSSIKTSDKKYIRIMTYNGDIFRYIPAKNRHIPVLRKNPSDGQIQPGRLGKKKS